MIIVMLAFLCGCQHIEHTDPMTRAIINGPQYVRPIMKPATTQRVEGTPFKTQRQESDDGSPVMSLAWGDGFTVTWLSNTGKQVTPLQVLRATADQMKYQQTTPMASDDNARALSEVMEAIDALQGTDDVSAPIKWPDTEKGN